MPNWYLLFFDHCGGAYRHMAPAATAFPNRDMLFTLGAHSIWPNKDDIEENTAKMRANWHELAPLTEVAPLVRTDFLPGVSGSAWAVDDDRLFLFGPRQWSSRSAV
jgi:hypothetical protein